MGFFFANPWAWWALGGIPAVLLIHLLRRKSRQVRVSTLFLIERALPSSEGGRRVRRLKNSLPLWVQIAAVLLLAFLLGQPRRIDQTSTQTVVAVLDASASMAAFHEEALRAAGDVLGRFASVSARTQWIFLRSDASRLAAGSDLVPALAEVRANWDPALRTHDFSESLRLARTLAGSKGAVVVFSDHPPGAGVAPGVSWISVGAPIANAGFVGGEARDDRWSALLKNFGSERAEIRWRIEGDAGWQTAALAGGAMSEVSGPWPPETDRIVLVLEDDRFALDNRLPLLRPHGKILKVRAAGGEKFARLFEQLLRIAEPAELSGANAADVLLAVSNPLSPQAFAGSAMIFAEDSGAPLKPLTGPIVAENHPLMESLNWQGLIARESFGIPVRDDDSVLLWQGARPLIVLRTVEDGRQLIFSFDVLQSNAPRLPAFALLAHRFFAMERRAKVAFEAVNGETGQQMAVAGAGSVKAPQKPGFFAVRGPNDSVLLEGAAQFSDSRESDFRAASTGGESAFALESVRQRHASGAMLDPLWAAILAAVMIWNWSLTGKPPARAQG
ncbi:MAG TPA: BatA domain-containing protein [Terrimicrobiaceae bacterium]|nr:BatA domain-containing protein [Terrimicrobiaceae bacterium]